jgi:predicted transcriptional regulator
MAQTVRLDDKLIRQVKAVAQAEDRSIPKQIEHWIKIGRMVEDNPDLTYEFIRNVLRGEAEVQQGIVTPYRRISKE